MASNKMMLMILRKLNGQGAMQLAQISSSLKRNDRNTLRDLESMEEQGLVERVKVDIKTSRGRNTVVWRTTASRELFRKVLKEDEWSIFCTLFPIAS
jgi:predicted ArsR family transcriptional regulator